MLGPGVPEERSPLGFIALAKVDRHVQMCPSRASGIGSGPVDKEHPTHTPESSIEGITLLGVAVRQLQKERKVRSHLDTCCESKRKCNRITVGYKTMGRNSSCLLGLGMSLTVSMVMLGA
jgi:hypothetical protein